jgi:hypothetical protein
VSPQWLSRELLPRRCGAWAQAHGLVMSLLLAETMLDSRHFSSDGRLGYWTPAQPADPEELTAAAGQSKVAGQLRAFAQWLGPKGRALTSARETSGRLMPGS